MPESWLSRPHLTVAGGDKGTTEVQSSYKLVSKGVQGMVLVVQPHSELGWCEHSSATEGTERRKGQLDKTRTRKGRKIK